MMPGVTVGVFSHNHAGYIADCIDPLLDAGKSISEVVFMDDASTDGTPGIIRQVQDELRANGISTQAVLGEQNLRFPARLNEFLSLVNTEWFMVHSADDFLLPGGIGKLVNLASSHPDADIVFGRLVLVDERGMRLRYPRRATRIIDALVRKYSIPEYPFRDLLRFGNFIPGGFTLVRRFPRQIDLPTYRTELTNAEDLDWYLSMGRCAKAVMLDSPVGCWRATSTSKSRSAGSEQTLSLLEIFRIRLLESPTEDMRLIQQAAIRAWLRPFGTLRPSRIVKWGALTSLPTMSTKTVLLLLPSVFAQEFLVWLRRSDLRRGE